MSIDSPTLIESASNEVIETIDVGSAPIFLLFNAYNNDIYVANFISDDVSVIQTNTISPNQPMTISDLIKGIIQNPLNVTNSIDSANEIRDILTDDNRDNDQLACEFLESGDEHVSNIREILEC